MNYNYIDDMKHGEFKSYYDGQLCEIGNMVNGKMNGEYKSYRMNGELKEFSYYIDGIKQ